MKKSSLFVVILILLIVAQVVYAKTITVDGDASEWDASELVIDDGNADGGGGGLDIDAVYFTNDSTSAYFRIDTVGTVDLSGDNHISILLDSDNNTGTGSTLAGLPGVDFWIAIDPGTGCDASFTAPAGIFALPGFIVSTTGVAFATSGSVLEVSVDLSAINVNSNRSMPGVIHTSGINGNCALQTTDATSPSSFAVPGPTAVTLQTISASTNNNFIIVLAMILVGVGTAAIALLIRRKQA